MGQNQQSDVRGYPIFEWINDKIKWISIVMFVVAITLGVIAPIVAEKGEPSFDPTGEIYDTDDLVIDRFFSSDSPIRGVSFVVEVADVPESPTAQDHDVLTAAALFEFKQNADAVRATYSTGTDAHLLSGFNFDLGIEIDGIFSIADAVDAHVPGGLANADDADVKRALNDLLADGSPTASLRFTLSRLADRGEAIVNGDTITVWRAAAFLADLRYDIDTFDPEQEAEGFGDATNLDAERWLRDVQTELRGDEEAISVLGLAIDPALVGEEQANAAAPFIFLAVAFILILVGALLRSYWATMVAAIGLSVVMMSYNGINALIGLKVESMFIVLIVPIALISFGIDFFIHGSGRTREAQVEGFSRARAYPVGATVLFTALFLAAASSVGAFLSNASSGIQAITEFGIAAAVAIALSYLVLGLVSPRQLLFIEEALGPRPVDHHLHVFRRLGYIVACLLAGVVVTLAIVMPPIGAALFVVVLLGGLFGLPFWLTRRRNRRAAEAGVPLTDEVKGAGHGFTAAGSLVHFVARWRVFTVPVVVVLAVLGVIGWTQVESAFDLKDLYSSETDLVKGLDKIGTHLGQSASGPAYIYIEGDLTSPEALLTLEGVVADLDSIEAEGRIELVRDFNGNLEAGLNAASLVRGALASPAAVEAIGATGVSLADANRDGLPDSADQIAAVYEFIAENGIPGEGAHALLRPDQVQGALYVDGNTQATRLEVYLPKIFDDENVLETRAVLEEKVADLETELAAFGPVEMVALSGGAILTQNTLDAFTGSMLTSLPIAIALTVLIALLVMRSVRYALITMVPILLVVTWVYGFMYVADYKINVITATIAAIAIGVGIDYATHFTVRFREEFEGEPSRFPALRRAGEGTGGALAISALTSITGFVVMAAAPMPMFAVFGALTAVMIFFAVLVSLLVLPSLLLLVTPSRKGEEREELEEAITHGEFEYKQHARETADLRHPYKGLRGGLEGEDVAEEEVDE
jgi:predicted RND superfamily exporter protein